MHGLEYSITLLVNAYMITQTRENQSDIQNMGRNINMMLQRSGQLN